MVSLAGSKGPLMGLILVVAYSSWVMDIIQMRKTVQNQNSSYNAPPAVVAMLVAGILQFLYCIWYLVRGGKGAAFKASNVAAAFLFFTLFQVASTAAFTALRYDPQYCPRDGSNFGDCQGVSRGTMGLGYSVVGLNLIYLIYLSILVKRFGTWSRDMWNIPERRHANADLDKAPIH